MLCHIHSSFDLAALPAQQTKLGKVITMKTNVLVSTIAILGLMSGAATSLHAEPGSHDHQATKTHIPSSASSKKTPTEKCTPKSDMDDSDEVTDTDSTNPESDKCEPEKKKDPIHDHREMKNL